MTTPVLPVPELEPTVQRLLSALRPLQDDAEAERTRPAPELWAWLFPRLAAGLQEPAASDVQFALLAAHAAAGRRPLAGELDGNGAEISF